MTSHETPNSAESANRTNAQRRHARRSRFDRKARLDLWPEVEQANREANTALKTALASAIAERDAARADTGKRADAHAAATAAELLRLERQLLVSQGKAAAEARTLTQERDALALQLESKTLHHAFETRELNAHFAHTLNQEHALAKEVLRTTTDAASAAARIAASLLGTQTSLATRYRAERDVARTEARGLTARLNHVEKQLGFSA